MENTLTKMPVEMFRMSRGWSFFCRTLMVLISLFLALNIMLPGISWGCGGRAIEHSTDYIFGLPFNWLIVTYSRMHGVPDATLVVINPRGVAWAVSFMCAVAAFFRLGWLKTRWRV